MPEPKNARGRPKGDGVDDTETLRKMATLIDVDPTLKPTAAMRRILSRPDDTTIRRLRRKWHERSAQLLDAARRPEPQHTPRRGVDIATLGALSRHTGMAALTASSATKTLQDYFNSPAMRTVREMMDDPVISATRAIMNDPVMRAARAMMDDPLTRLAREQAKLSAVRLAQDRAARGIDSAFDNLRKTGLL